MRGALVGQVGWQGDYASKLFYASRTFGPVSERTLILSVIKHLAIFKSKILRADIGPVLMNEQFDIKFDQTADKGWNRSENNYNLGGVVGLNLGINSGKFLFETAWNSHLFPAGLAGIFLASGRKQTLSVTMGMRL